MEIFLAVCFDTFASKEKRMFQFPGNNTTRAMFSIFNLLFQDLIRFASPSPTSKTCVARGEVKLISFQA
jgi:hypothetical protein